MPFLTAFSIDFSRFEVKRSSTESGHVGFIVDRGYLSPLLLLLVDRVSMLASS